MLSICLLFVVLYDSVVLLFEAAGLLVAYLIYVVALAMDRKLQSCFRSIYFKNVCVHEIICDFLQLLTTIET